MLKLDPFTNVLSLLEALRSVEGQFDSTQQEVRRNVIHKEELRT